MGREMAPGGPSPLTEAAMSSVMTPTVRVPWRRSRAAYAQSRQMLWDAAPPPPHGIGWRSMPPVSAGLSTQPGRERPHAARPDIVPRRLDGVAHIPAADVSSSPHSARECLVLSTNDSRPTSLVPVVTRSASLRGGPRVRLSA
jgi:hypothetical protein